MRNTTGLEYQLSKEMFEKILSTRNETEKKMNPNAYVMGYINDQFGLRGTVKSLFVSLT